MPPLPIIQMSARPGVIELGFGQPDPALLPAEGLRCAADAALARWGASALAYGAERGPGPLLEWLGQHLAQIDGRAPEPGELLITAGVSQAIDQICTLCAHPGDIVLAESPCYHLALRIFRDHPLELRAAATDGQGLDIAALADQLAALRRAGRTPRLLYTIPTFNNPTGTSLPAGRRRALVELAAHEGLLIIEDDVYRELAYDSAAPPSLWSMAAPGTVVRLGSFAKSLAPGLRLGWLTAGTALVRRCVSGGVIDSGGGVNHFTGLIVAQYGISGQYAAQVARFRTAYRARRDALLDGLRASMPAGCAWDAPAGGYFVWLRLPEGMDAAALLPQAEAAGVSYVPGARFHCDTRGANGLRLAFSLYGEADLSEGARRLGAALGQ